LFEILFNEYLKKKVSGSVLEVKFVSQLSNRAQSNIFLNKDTAKVSHANLHQNSMGGLEADGQTADKT
jgi:hypothetical protein